MSVTKIYTGGIASSPEGEECPSIRHEETSGSDGSFKLVHMADPSTIQMKSGWEGAPELDLNRICESQPSDPLGLYSCLRIPVDSSEKIIKAGFRKAALRYHPDKNTNNRDLATKCFQAAFQAFRVLSNPERRAHYDSSGSIIGDFETDESEVEKWESLEVSLTERDDLEQQNLDQSDLGIDYTLKGVDSASATRRGGHGFHKMNYAGRSNESCLSRCCRASSSSSVGVISDLESNVATFGDYPSCLNRSASPMLNHLLSPSQLTVESSSQVSTSSRAANASQNSSDQKWKNGEHERRGSPSSEDRISSFEPQTTRIESGVLPAPVDDDLTRVLAQAADSSSRYTTGRGSKNVGLGLVVGGCVRTCEKDTWSLGSNFGSSEGGGGRSELTARLLDVGCSGASDNSSSLCDLGGESDSRIHCADKTASLAEKVELVWKGTLGVGRTAGGDFIGTQEAENEDDDCDSIKSEDSSWVTVASDGTNDGGDVLDDAAGEDRARDKTSGKNGDENEAGKGEDENAVGKGRDEIAVGKDGDQNAAGLLASLMGPNGRAVLADMWKKYYAEKIAELGSDDDEEYEEDEDPSDTSGSENEDDDDNSGSEWTEDDEKSPQETQDSAHDDGANTVGPKASSINVLSKLLSDSSLKDPATGKRRPRGNTIMVPGRPVSRADHRVRLRFRSRAHRKLSIESSPSTSEPTGVPPGKTDTKASEYSAEADVPYKTGPQKRCGNYFDKSSGSADAEDTDGCCGPAARKKSKKKTVEP